MQEHQKEPVFVMDYVLCSGEIVLLLACNISATATDLLYNRSPFASSSRRGSTAAVYKKSQKEHVFVMDYVPCPGDVFLLLECNISAIAKEKC